MSYAEEYKAYELGYNLKSQYWGMGYATEASNAMIRWAYQSLGARDFFARHANENYASGNVIKKCGFQFENYGTLEKYADRRARRRRGRQDLRGGLQARLWSLSAGCCFRLP